SGYLCSNGHESSEPDFCSVCGVKVRQSADSPGTCPDCGAAREAADSVFCQDCGRNFESGAPGEARPVWEIEITVDPTLKAAESPDPPASFAPIQLRVAAESSLIGRRSDKRGILPEIALDFDDAVSHRHALLNRAPDGSLVLRDVGSANGTRLNDAELEPLTDMPLKDGDQFTVGHWTRIRVRAVV
ncbi:MAG TPA: FHA domain-containing protein, partial [Bryobacteraceae bacterium]|nr:FHA domain-containing protein [Bryobacteraceae bacterium]